ncbi:retrovirus-related pol polyprotein from transposon TNT 1-94 [Tanacetum coccineum]
MSGTIPPIPPPFGTSSGNPGSPNVNRVNTIPTTTDPINTTTTTNVSQSVVDENIPQLLDSKGGSHVTNVPTFDKEDFTNDEGSTKIRAFMAIIEDEPSVGKADARSVLGNIVKALGGKGRRKEKISSKEEPLPPLPKIIGSAPSSTSESLISLSDLILNMADLTLDTPVPKKTRPSVKVSPTYVIKKKIEKSPTVPKPCFDKKADSSTEQLLLTLIKEDYLKRFVWYLDSGCSRHMTEIKQYLHRYSKKLVPKVVFGDDSSGDTKGYDLVNCNRITFTRVAYVNGLKHNLISISQLCDANYKVKFTKTQGTIYNQNDEVILIAPRKRDVYVIDMTSFNKESNACFFAKASPSVNWLWHKRLSHLNFKNINNLAKHNLVSGLPSLTFSKDKNYSACEKGKHHRASFKTKRSFSINKRMENLNEVRVKELRSDNGTEFRNHKLEEFCDEKCISQNFSSPCTPEQNGVAERRNKTLIEAARTMINMAKAFRVFNIRRQEMEKAVHVTFSEDDEAISQSSSEADEINFNENISFPNDEFLEPMDPPEFIEADNHLALNEPGQTELVDHFEPVKPQNDVIIEPINRWLRENHIELVNIIGEPLADITTRSRIRDSDAALTSECLYVNFLSEMEPKNLIKALEE